MHPLTKTIIGIILLVVPIIAYVYEYINLPAHFFQGKPYELHLLGSLWTVIQGIIPPALIILGIFIIWLELDEWRIEKELQEEEKKTKKKKKK